MELKGHTGKPGADAHDALEQCVIKTSPNTMVHVPPMANAHDYAPPYLRYQGRLYSYWRPAARELLHGHHGDCYKACDAKMTVEDIAAINKYCEFNHENQKNRTMKLIVRDALAQYFNGLSYHVTEFGFGRAPLADYLPANGDVSYHGIECDPTMIRDVGKRGLSVSGWPDASAYKPDGKKPAIAVGVYSLHFMADENLAQRIKDFTSAGDGFYVGNFHIDQHEAQRHLPRNSKTPFPVNETPSVRREMAKALRQAGMSRIILHDPYDTHSEIWIIGKPESFASMTKFAEILGESYNAQHGSYISYGTQDVYDHARAEQKRLQTQAPPPSPPKAG